MVLSGADFQGCIKGFILWLKGLSDVRYCVGQSYLEACFHPVLIGLGLASGMS